jgi:hypothetical protein
MQDGYAAQQGMAHQAFAETHSYMAGNSVAAPPPHYTITDNMTGQKSFLNFPFGADN